MDDPFNLQRFVNAQDPVISGVRAELRSGHKTGHWMWFVFPQLVGLGFSEMSRRYAIGSVREAVAYLEHPVLGPCLREISGLVMGTEGRSARQIFGSPDDMKLHACMTLFEGVEADGGVFRDVLRKYFAGQPHQATQERLAHRP